MKYSDIDSLDQRIEKVIDSTVKHYYSDWSKYDRPKYMGFKGSEDKADKDLVLIARENGTYLVRCEDVKKGNDWACTIYDYFQNQEKADYYHIDINNLECTRITKPETYLKKERSYV